MQDAEQARRNFELLRAELGPEELAVLLPAVLSALSASGDPDMALNNLERFVGSLADAKTLPALCRSRPELLSLLITVFGASRFLSASLIAAPEEGAARLSAPGYLDHPAGREELAGRLGGRLAEGTDEKAFFRVLRQFRKEELLRIALRDLLGKGELAGIVTELSALAEACLQAACVRIRMELAARFGRPMIERQGLPPEEAGFAVIAMGKLGGNELNFSSDIDLMYVYTADGETEGVRTADGAVTGRISNHEFFNKLSEKLSAAIGQATEDGFVFRVDLRLRPEGQRGPLAQSLGGYEIYYESWGQAWERAALVKARFVAGDEAVGRAFIERITPFVYRKYLDYGAIVEIREMKRKINREVQQKGREHRDVKLGYGGIREVEFLVQALQLLYGGRDRTLRERGTLKALHILSLKGLLTYQETADLSKAYVFLRTVEHRIQMLDDRQTQTMPSDGRELRCLARRCGYLEPGKEIDGLLRDYGRHTERARSLYDVLLAQTGEETGAESAEAPFAELLDPGTGEQEAVSALAGYGFREPSRAYRNLLLLREGAAFVHQTPRSRRLFNELFPLLFREVAASPDADMALNHLESFLAVQGSWEAFQSFAGRDPNLVRILIAVFANSEYFSRMLIRSPSLLQDLLDTGRSFSLGTAEIMRKDLSSLLATADGVPAKLDALRRFKHREEVRIGMADLFSSVPLPAVSRALSRLAEVSLRGMFDLACSEVSRRFGTGGQLRGLAVIGAGKLGGRELTYGSDLDILFVYSEERTALPPAELSVFELFSKVAEKTISYLTAMTREGFAYRVDTRLRPTGSKGPLVQSIRAFRIYYSGQAETWERQALVNGRFVAGDAGVGREFIGTIADLIYRDADRAALAGDILAMRKRMEDELGKENPSRYNIKQGYGGLVDIEFLAQCLQLVHGRETRGVRVPGTYNALRALRREGLLGREEYPSLMQAYLFLRTLESRMRIVTNQAAHDLSRDPNRLRPLARRIGYEDDALTAGEKLLRNYERMRKEVRDAFERIVGE